MAIKNDFFYFGLAIFLLLMSCFVGMALSQYYEHLETQQALENGYIQTVDEFGRKLWVKE